MTSERSFRLATAMYFLIFLGFAHQAKGDQPEQTDDDSATFLLDLIVQTSLHPFCLFTSQDTTSSLSPLIDGQALPFGEGGKHVLLYRNTHQAEFASAVWKDDSGHLVREREVLVIKPDYGVVVDFVYTPGLHTTERSFTFYELKVVRDAQGAQAKLESPDRTVRVQALEPVKVTPKASISGPVTVFTSQATFPAAISTVFASWKEELAPKIESIETKNPLLVRFKVTFPDGRIDEVALASESHRLELNGRDFEAWAVCSRHDSTGNRIIEIK